MGVGETPLRVSACHVSSSVSPSFSFVIYLSLPLCHVYLCLSIFLFCHLSVSASLSCLFACHVSSSVSPSFSFVIYLSLPLCHVYLCLSVFLFCRLSVSASLSVMSLPPSLHLSLFPSLCLCLFLCLCVYLCLCVCVCLCLSLSCSWAIRGRQCVFQGRVRELVVAVCGMCRYQTVPEVSLSIEYRIGENTKRDSVVLGYYFGFCRLLDETCFEKAGSLKSVVCLFSCTATVSLLPQACLCGGQCVVRA